MFHIHVTLDHFRKTGNEICTSSTENARNVSSEDTISPSDYDFLYEQSQQIDDAMFKAATIPGAVLTKL